MKCPSVKSTLFVITVNSDPAGSNHICCVHRFSSGAGTVCQLHGFKPRLNRFVSVPIVVKSYLKEGVKTYLSPAFPKAHYSNITGARHFRTTDLRGGEYLDLSVARGIQ